ncbi:hypothetical protein CEXT_442481 [Caerostris extrusa]|uniref:Uncharacterized protein n=1 Tax=Caerostris extrusa TaxID=172846 RepID=A0AAV4X0G7_CAEEX|nr:hypothetical protein CEXT_442481 [Caerostris extrusa]
MMQMVQAGDLLPLDSGKKKSMRGGVARGQHTRMSHFMRIIPAVSLRSTPCPQKRPFHEGFLCVLSWQLLSFNQFPAPPPPPPCASKQNISRSLPAPVMRKPPVLSIRNSFLIPPSV